MGRYTICGYCGVPMMRIGDDLICPICHKRIKGSSTWYPNGLLLALLTGLGLLWFLNWIFNRRDKHADEDTP